MDYTFPYISHIDHVLPHIADHPEFFVADKGDYKIINYQVVFATSFPPVYVDDQMDHAARVRRECRGLVFDKNGHLIRRPYQKFFNAGEHEETRESKLVTRFSSGSILEKLDGSMISPFQVSSGEIIWGTKMAAEDFHEMVYEFVRYRPQYTGMAYWAFGTGHTLMFEWCTRRKRIVLDYPDDRLVLTGIRKTYDGGYMPYQHMEDIARQFDVDYVKQFPMHEGGLKSFVEYVKDIKDAEGFVWRDYYGHMFKAKGEQYVQIHKAKESLLQDRHIVKMFFNNELDDIKPHLPDEDLQRLSIFERKLQEAFECQLELVLDVHKDIAYRQISRKDFAIRHAQNYNPLTKALIFATFDKPDTLAIREGILRRFNDYTTNNNRYAELQKTWLHDARFNY